MKLPLVRFSPPFSSLPFPFSAKFAGVLSLLAIGTLVGLHLTFQVLEKIWSVNQLIDTHRREFANADKQIHANIQHILEQSNGIRTRLRRRVPLNNADNEALRQTRQEIDDDDDDEDGQDEEGAETSFPAPGIPDPLFCRCEYENRCPAGEPGPPGVPGEDGIPGLPGPPGVPGLPGNFPAILYDFGQNCRICPMGERGEPGRIGLPGEAGIPGRTGVPGRHGKSGPRGKRGSPGIAGDRGFPGKTGTKGVPGNAAIGGGKGSPGHRGRPGRAGRRGPPGEPGENGKNGQPGRRGPPGHHGRRGRKGEPGKAGKRGIKASPGPDALYCPCPREKLRSQLLRPTGYSPKNPFGRKRPHTGHIMGAPAHRRGNKHSHDIVKNDSEQ